MVCRRMRMSMIDDMEHILFKIASTHQGFLVFRDCRDCTVLDLLNQADLVWFFGTPDIRGVHITSRGDRFVHRLRKGQ